MDDVTLDDEVVIPAAELRFRFTRSSGPGGQNVNKRATRAELIFDLAGTGSLPDALKARAMRRLAARLDAEGTLRVVSDEARTQAENRRLALERFEGLMKAALRPPPPPRRPTKPTKTARERRLREKRARGDIKRARRSPESAD